MVDGVIIIALSYRISEYIGTNFRSRFHHRINLGKNFLPD